MGAKSGKHYHSLHPTLLQLLAKAFIAASLNLTQRANTIYLISLFVTGTLNIGDFPWKWESETNKSPFSITSVLDHLKFTTNSIAQTGVCFKSTCKS